MDSVYSFMNSLTYKLISNNMLPHKNQYGQYMAFGAYRVLEKSYANNVSIVKIINGDLLNSGNIRLEIAKSIDIIRERKLAQLKPLNLHFIICTNNNFTIYKQMADKFQNVLQNDSISMCVTIVNTFINNTYTINESGYINSSINNMAYQSFGGRLIYDHDIENILSGLGSRYQQRQPFTLKGKISATKIFIAVNVLFWVLGIASEFFLEYDIFKAFGVQHSLAIKYGKQYWRFVTPIFLHGGLIHMISNSYFLFICGELVEKYIGKTKFVIFYLVTGIVGNIVSFFTIDPRVASLGASGACLGIGGVLVYMWLNKQSNFLKYYSGITSLIIMIVINIFYGFTTTGIDNGAHVGGFISGFVLAFIVDKTIGLGKDKTHKIHLS